MINIICPKKAPSSNRRIRYGGFQGAIKFAAQTMIPRSPLTVVRASATILNLSVACLVSFPGHPEGSEGSAEIAVFVAPKPILRFAQNDR